MKTMIKSAIMLGLVLLFAGTTQKASAQDEDVSLQSFYDELSPYGTWIQDPQYGYVWRPDVDQEEFRPYYTNGRWVMTEYGNTWVSNYDWGWAPFHYGRWVYNNYNQWIWLPDTVWGPAWVSWRSGGGYYGWAPLGPSVSIGINIGRGGYRVPDMCWSFIPYANIYYNSYPRYNWNRNRVYIQNTVIINHTYVHNNRTYYTGPRIDDIRRETNQRVNVYAINRSHSPGTRIENNRVNIYQPRPSRDGRNNSPAPRNVVQGNINRAPVGRSANGTANNGNNRSQGAADNRGNSNNGNQANRSDSRSNTTGNSNGGYSRPQRAENGNNGNINATSRANNGRVGQAPPSTDNNVINQRPSVFGRERNSSNPSQSADRNAQDQQAQQQVQQRADRSREMAQQQQAQQQQTQQRAERSREMAQQQQAQQQQAQQQQAQQRAERSREQQAQQQQRAERPQQQSAPRAERVERSQPQQQAQPQQRSSGGESRGNSGREGASGRPGRG
jgi:hypothetical protein